MPINKRIKKVRLRSFTDFVFNVLYNWGIPDSEIMTTPINPIISNRMVIELSP